MINNFSFLKRKLKISRKKKRERKKTVPGRTSRQDKNIMLHGHFRPHQTYPINKEKVVKERKGSRRSGEASFH